MSADLNVMMREQAQMGLQRELDDAVTNGDTAKAQEVTKKITALALASAPKAPPFGDAEIRAELDKQPWYGTDPKKSAKAVEFGKTMDPRKFASAEAFATAIIKAVDEEFKPTGTTEEPGDGGETEGEAGSGEETEGETGKAAAGKPRRTDGPNEGETVRSSAARRASGPWTKLADAPAEVQKEVSRTADKFAPKTKEGRAAYVTRALEAHYAAHVRNKGKK